MPRTSTTDKDAERDHLSACEELRVFLPLVAKHRAKRVDLAHWCWNRTFHWAGQCEAMRLASLKGRRHWADPLELKRLALARGAAESTPEPGEDLAKHLYVIAKYWLYQGADTRAALVREIVAWAKEVEAEAERDPSANHEIPPERRQQQDLQCIVASGRLLSDDQRRLIVRATCTLVGIDVELIGAAAAEAMVDALDDVIDWAHEIMDGRPLSRPPHPERLQSRSDGPKVLPFNVTS